MDVPAVVAELGRTGQGLVAVDQLGRHGVSSAALSRAVQAGRLVRPRPGVYAATDLPPVPRFLLTDAGPAPAYVAQVRAVLLSLGPGAAACGRTAATLWHWELLVEPSRTVEVAVPHGRSRAGLRGVRLEQRRRAPRAGLVVLPGTHPLPVTTAVRTVVDCCLRLPLLEGVVVADSALRSRHVTMADLGRAADGLAGVRDARRLRAVLRLCDPAAGSVLESVLRVRLRQAGIDGFQTQRTVRDAHGRHVLRTDFRFPAARLVVEADGARWHEQPSLDRQTDNRLARLGWRVMRFGWADVVHQPDAVVAAVRAALAWPEAA